MPNLEPPNDQVNSGRHGEPAREPAREPDADESSLDAATRITRRDALARLMALTGTIAVGAELFLTGCRASDAARRAEPFTPGELALLDEIAETIIPATDTPGAKAAGVGAFMAATATDCYDAAAYGSFRRGLERLDAASRKRAGKPFMESSPAERTALLEQLDREQLQHTRERDEDEPPHYFRLMKELALVGYFTSEIGCTQALRYVESPGSYDGDLPYRTGDRAYYNPARRINLG